MTAPSSAFDRLLADFGERRLFVIYEIRPKADGKPGTDKVPVDPRTRANIDCHVEANRLTGAEAALYRAQGVGSGIGLVLTPTSNLFALDLDHCAEHGQWAPYVAPTLAQFPGAYIEVSQSGEGIHGIGSYLGPRPLHRTRCKELRAELYTGDRFIALTGINATGSVLSDHTAALAGFMAERFPPRENENDESDHGAGPVSQWNGPTDDAALIEVGLRMASPRATFGGGASFAQLYHGDADALSRAFPPQTAGQAYDASAADLALFNHLAFLTGNDSARMERIALTSALVRPKWQRDDYRLGTIARACAGTSQWYSERSPVAPASNGGPVPPAPSTPPAATGDSNPYLRQALPYTDFVSVLADGCYLYLPTRETWPKKSVDIACGDGVAARIDREAPVHQMLWAPGEPEYIRGRLLVGGGWIDKADVGAFNLYRPPLVIPGDATNVQPWIDHLTRIYPDHVGHIVRWLAHRVQCPGVKINHALVFGGGSGIGKDTILEPIRHAVGPWNMAEVAPAALFGRFNGYVKSVVLRVSEVKGDDVNPFDFYELTKTLCAAPPESLRCDEKNIAEHQVLNVTGVILTTNHLVGGLYLPREDRRHYVAWGTCTKEQMQPYCAALWAWYKQGGLANVVAYLRAVDISDFDPKAPPMQTSAWQKMAGAGASPEAGDLLDALDELGQPVVVTIAQILAKMADGSPGKHYLLDTRQRRTIPHRMNECGYVRFDNPNAPSGRWKFKGVSVTVYQRTDTAPLDALTALRALMD